MAATLVPDWVNRFETAGIKANRSKDFSLTFTGTEIYALLQLLETLAQRGGAYPEVSRFVLGAEMIRDRAKAQGF